MKEYIFIIFCFIAGMAVVAGLVFGMRAFNNAATPILVHEPVPGVQCATMTTSDGAAIDCWKVGQ